MKFFYYVTGVRLRQSSFTAVWEHVMLLEDELVIPINSDAYEEILEVLQAGHRPRVELELDLKLTSVPAPPPYKPAALTDPIYPPPGPPRETKTLEAEDARIYKTLVARSPADLDRKVNRAIKRGYLTFGVQNVAPDPSSSAKKPMSLYSQTMKANGDLQRAWSMEKEKEGKK